MLVYDKLEQTMRDWENLLLETCEEQLKPEFNAREYSEIILDKMYTGESYESEGGTPYYYEIPKRHTKSGLPVVVTMVSIL